MNLQIYFLGLLLLVCSSSTIASKYGSKTFDQWTWLTSHNSHVNWKDSKILDALTNQYFSIEQQLDYGIRGFMLDIDWKECSSFEIFFGACKCKGICLCHGPCTDLLKDGFHIKNFEYALNTIVNFLNQNREEIVTIFLEDYIDDVRKLQKVFRGIQGFSDMVFNPYSSQWNVSEHGWPKIIDMINSNKRILIVDDEQRGFHAKKWPGIIRSRDFLIQNHYEWQGESYQWDNFNQTNFAGLLSGHDNIDIVNNTAYINMSPCYSLHKNYKGPLWHEDKKLDLLDREHTGQVQNGKKLFLFNHFVGVKALTKSMNQLTQLLMNKKEFIEKRLEDKCHVGTNYKRPNYIALDFIERNDYANLIEPFNAD